MMAEALKCDVEGCGHVEHVGTITATWRNTPPLRCATLRAGEHIKENGYERN